MSTLRVNTIESFTTADALNLNDKVQISGSTASGANAFSHGRETVADGFASHAEGQGASTTGSYAHAEGRFTSAFGSNSHAEGNLTVTRAAYSHAEGSSTEVPVSAVAAHAEGQSTIASESYSHAEGHNTGTKGVYSHAEGSGSTASGHSSHAEGHLTEASGIAAHSQGKSTLAQGNYSFASGHNTVATQSYQTVVGAYNASSSLPDDAYFVVGNGIINGLRGNLAVFASESITLGGGPSVDIILDTGSIPTTDPSVVGQLYMTSSAHFGGPAAKFVLMISV